MNDDVAAWMEPGERIPFEEMGWYGYYTNGRDYSRYNAYAVDVYATFDGNNQPRESTLLIPMFRAKKWLDVVRAKAVFLSADHPTTVKAKE